MTYLDSLKDCSRTVFNASNKFVQEIKDNGLMVIGNIIIYMILPIILFCTIISATIAITYYYVDAEWLKIIKITLVILIASIIGLALGLPYCALVKYIGEYNPNAPRWSRILHQ